MALALMTLVLTRCAERPERLINGSDKQAPDTLDSKGWELGDLHH